MPGASERATGRTCAWCGRWVAYTGVGRRPQYCSKGCRNRAWELRSAERRLQRDIAAGSISRLPAREVVEVTPPPTKAPTNAKEWVRMLAELENQIRDGKLGREHWHHPRLWAAMTQAAAALDAATPGGVARIRRK